MTPRTIITNGQTAVEAISRTGLEGSILSWDDVLHDGPVPSGMELEDLSFVRARFVADVGWAAYEEARNRFSSRDKMFRSIPEDHEILCWFEHDLYDQLQLWQVLSELRAMKRRHVYLICTNRYVGPAAPEALLKDFEERIPVSNRMLGLAARLWDAFKAPTPEALSQLSETVDVSALPFARENIRRWFEEYPKVGDGLTRTERIILEQLREAGTPIVGGVLFQKYQESEDAMFMGDASFETIIRRLESAPSPLIHVATQEQDDEKPWLATVTVRAVEDPPRFGPGFGIPGGSRWMGGVHIQPGMEWYWNTTTGQFHFEP